MRDRSAHVSQPEEDVEPTSSGNLEERIGARKEIIRKALLDFVDFHRAQDMDAKLSNPPHDFKKQRQGVFLEVGGPHWNRAIAYNNAVWRDGASILALLEVLKEQTESDVLRLAHQYLSLGMATGVVSRPDCFSRLYEQGVPDILAQQAAVPGGGRIAAIALEALESKLSDPKWSETRDRGDEKFLSADSISLLMDAEAKIEDPQSRTMLITLLGWLYRDQVPELKVKLLMLAQTDSFDPALRRAALEGLKDPDMKDPEIQAAIENLIRAAPNASLTLAALDVYSAGWVITPDQSTAVILFERLQDLLRVATDPEIRAAAVQIVRRYDRPEAARLVANYYPSLDTQSKSELFRHLAYSYFEPVPYQNARQAYVDLANTGTVDSDCSVRMTAYTAALSFCARGMKEGDSAQILAASQLLRRMSEDTDPSIRNLGIHFKEMN